jgi:iron complex transport system substrate-binding protein
MRSIKLLIIFLFSVLINISCVQENSRNDVKSEISVVDFRGKEIHLKNPVGKAVCLIESALSGIYMLEAGNSIAGIPSSVYNDDLFKYYSKLDDRILQRRISAPGNWDFVSIEGILDLEPDLVIIWSSQVEAIKSLENLNIPVYAVMLNNFNDIYKEIRDFGILFNKEKRADSLINYTKSNLNKIKNSNQSSKRSAYFMWAQGINETSGINSTVNELFYYADILNVCRMPQEHVSVSIEKIYDWNPDMIIMWYNEKIDPGDIISDPLLQRIKAVRNKEVYELPGVFDSDFWTLKMQNAVYLISRWAYNTEQDTSINLRNVYRYLYNKDLIQ